MSENLNNYLESLNKSQREAVENTSGATLVLAGAGTYSNSLKIAIAPAIAVTAGQALSYQISFANQASSSKEARIYGVAMTY